MHYFSIFYKRFNKTCVRSLRFWTKNTFSWKFLENYRKHSKGFLGKLRKFNEKRQLLENFKKILKSLDENSIEN